MRVALALVLVASTAVADPPRVTRLDPQPGARAQAWTATAVTALFVGAGVFSVVRARQESNNAADLFARNAPATDQLAAIDRADHWHDAVYAFAGLTVVSVAITGVLWDRAQPHYRVSLTAQSAMIGYATRF